MKRMVTAMRRGLLVGAAVTLAVTTITTTAPAHEQVGSQAALAPAPLVRLMTSSDSVTLPRYRQRVDLNLGIYAAAGDDPFEIRAHRPNWDTPIQAFLEMPGGGEVALPDGAMENFSQVQQFFHLTFTDGTGTRVLNRYPGFCPTGDAVRIDPNAPHPARAYPSYCPYNPYTRGGVYGISPGHAVPALGYYGNRAKLPLGDYTATLTIKGKYAAVIGISPADRTSTVTVHVVDGSNCVAASPAAGCVRAKSAGQARQGPRSSAVPRRPSAHVGMSRVAAAPPSTPLPDLRSLPAYAIQLGRKGFVSFAATVWNAGPSPLVVDGIRHQGEDVMDAYQYFYDASGNEVGHAPAGTMEWDARQGHQHWHFQDFAQYQLLDVNKNLVVRSRKEAFCLANTDAVDYTVDRANWNPYNTDLHTACGDHSALGVREVLDTGSGDTYFQSLPGQSFNIKNLPNGVYYIAIKANLNGVLQEANTANNNSFRKIILKGTAANRRVVVPQKGIIDETTAGYYY